MRFLLVFFALTTATVAARAQDGTPPPDASTDLAPAPLAPPPTDPPTDPPVLEPPPVAPLAPDAAPTPVTPADQPVAQRGCSWPVVFGGGAFSGGALALGGVMLCVGGLMASINPASNSDNCAQACIESLFAAFVVVIGVVIAGAALVVLGPIAAVATTIASAGAAGGMGRTWWPALLGGSVGVVTSLIGTGMVIAAGTSGTPAPFVGGQGFNPSEGPHMLFMVGIGLLAASGPISLAGALGLDAVLGEQLVEDKAEDKPPPGTTTARATDAPRGASVTAMAY